MKVLVTGGCGFLGFHVCSHFEAIGADVVAYDSLAKHEFARNPYMRDVARDHNRIELRRLGVLWRLRTSVTPRRCSAMRRDRITSATRRRSPR